MNSCFPFSICRHFTTAIKIAVTGTDISRMSGSLEDCIEPWTLSTERQTYVELKWTVVRVVIDLKTITICS
jgi:hypothetical protein